MQNKLKLLEYTNKLFKNVSLKDTLLIACQHILEDNFQMQQYLFKQGLKPKNTYLIGKCYSSNKEVFNEIKKFGVNISPDSLSFDSHQSFDEQFDKYITKFLHNIIKKENFSKYKKIVILDDGGHLISHVNKTFKDFSNVTGVEQTSSGYTKLKKEKLNFPVVNVARTKAKLIYESPFIAEIIIQELNKSLKTLPVKPKSVLIIGGGPIGQEAEKSLKTNYKTNKFDLVDDLSDFKKTSLESIIGNYDLIIGAAGETILNKKYLGLLKKDCILVSTSSSDREFNAIELRKKVPQTHDCHENIYVNGIYLLNCGFPINFHGGRNSVTAKKMQLTYTLLNSGIYLGCKNNYKPGIIKISDKRQNDLIRRFQDDLNLN